MSILENARKSVALCEASEGPRHVVVVSGSENDREFWLAAVRTTAVDVFRRDGSTEINSVAERQRKGNFLGTLHAWKTAAREFGEVPPLALVTMVFGKGKRLSPFTQTLGDRKSAFPSPRLGEMSQTYLNAADISNLYTNLWFDHLRRGGFRGILVKWGDEAIVPSARWTVEPGAFATADAVRFVWVTEPDATLASQKDWIVVDAAGDMRQMITRQPERELHAELATYTGSRIGVNLGSLAVSHQLLDAAEQTFRAELESDCWIDWDPFIWMALYTESAADWQRVREREAARGSNTLAALEARVRDFHSRVQEMRQRLEAGTGRPLRVATLDFGNAFWLDFGLQRTLRVMFSRLTEASEEGRLLRVLFGLPEERDGEGNVVVRSFVAPGARLESSVVIDSHIHSDASVLAGALVVSSHLGEVVMRDGGALIECDAERVIARGPNALAFRVVEEVIDLSEGDRLSELWVRPAARTLRSNESISDADATYDRPVMENEISFDQASQAAGSTDWRDQLVMWSEAREAFRGK
jgi:hypothetical protein